MTDLKLNLKAGSLKRFLAMFMAICLTVLSVNVPVFAEEVTDEDAQVVAVDEDADAVVEEDDAAPVEEETQTEDEAQPEEAAQAEDAADDEDVAFDEVVVGGEDLEDAEEAVGADDEKNVFDGYYEIGYMRTGLTVPIYGLSATNLDAAYTIKHETKEGDLPGAQIQIKGKGIDPVTGDITYGFFDGGTTPLNGLSVRSTGERADDGAVIYQIIVPENKESGKLFFKVEITVADGNKEIKREIGLVQDYLAVEDPEVFDDMDLVLDTDGNVVTAFDGVKEDGTPDYDKNATTRDPNKFTYVTPTNALDKNLFAGDMENIVTANNGEGMFDDAKYEKGKEALLKAGVLTVTVYDGLPKKEGDKKNPLGNIVAVYKVKLGTELVSTYKLEAVKSNYVDGKFFDDFYYLDGAGVLDAKGKLTIKAGDFKIDNDHRFNIYDPVKSNMIVMANYAPAFEEKIGAAPYTGTDVFVEAGKTAIVQAYFANGVKLKVAKLTKDEKKIVKSAKVNVKAGTITFKAGKTAGNVAVTINGLKDPFVYNVHVIASDKVKDCTTLTNGIELKASNFATQINLDKNSQSAASKTAQLIVNPMASDVKYLITDKADLKSDAFADDKAFKAAAKTKEAKAAKKVVSVSNTGKVKAKNFGTAYVYAVRVTKGAKPVVSNPVQISVTGTATSFSMSGGAILKMKKDQSVWTTKKNKTVKFTVKVKGKATDKVAVRALDYEGKVVLGALRKTVKSSKKNGNQFVDNSYYNTLFAGYKAKDGTEGYRVQDSLLVVGTSPIGEQHYRMLKFKPAK